MLRRICAGPAGELQLPAEKRNSRGRPTISTLMPPIREGMSAPDGCPYTSHSGDFLATVKERKDGVEFLTLYEQNQTRCAKKRMKRMTSHVFDDAVELFAAISSPPSLWVISPSPHALVKSYNWLFTLSLLFYTGGLRLPAKTVFPDDRAQKVSPARREIR
jgi:hypothetical protein